MLLLPPPWISRPLRWTLHGGWALAAATSEAGIGLWLRRIGEAGSLPVWLGALGALLAARVGLSWKRDLERETLALEAGRHFHRVVWSRATWSGRDPAWLVREGRDSVEAGTRAALEVRTAAATLALSLPLMVWIAPWISLAALGAMAVVALLARRKSSRLARIAAADSEADERLSLEEEWAWRAVPEARPAGFQAAVARSRRTRFAGAAEARLDRIRSQLRLGAGGEALAHLAGWTLGAAALVSWKAGLLPPGSLLAFLGLALLAYRPVREAGRHLPNLRRAEQAWKSVSAPPEKTDTRSSGPAGVRDLRVVLADGATPVLDGISFDIPPGAVVLVHGPNGCGKSTLLRVLSGCGIPRTGEVRAPRRVFWMAQEPVLPPLPPEEWIARPPEDLVRSAFPRGLPASLRTGEPIPAGGQKLSRGERARLCLLAATSRPRELWILDEPLSALPPAEGARFLKAVLERRRGAAAVLAQPEPPPGFVLGASLVATRSTGPAIHLLEPE